MEFSLFPYRICKPNRHQLLSFRRQSFWRIDNQRQLTRASPSWNSVDRWFHPRTSYIYGDFLPGLYLLRAPLIPALWTSLRGSRFFVCNWSLKASTLVLFFNKVESWLSSLYDIAYIPLYFARYSSNPVRFRSDYWDRKKKSDSLGKVLGQHRMHDCLGS